MLIEIVQIIIPYHPGYFFYRMLFFFKKLQALLNPKLVDIGKNRHACMLLEQTGYMADRAIGQPRQRFQLHFFIVMLIDILQNRIYQIIICKIPSYRPYDRLLHLLQIDGLCEDIADSKAERPLSVGKEIVCRDNYNLAALTF